MTIIERDEQGRIVKKVLSSEKAAEMGRRSHAKRSSETANRILAEAGFDADNQAPEHLQVLADYAVSGKSGSVVALRDFRKLTSSEETTVIPDQLTIKPGQKCPTCRQYLLTDLQLTDEQTEWIWDSIGIDKRFEDIESSPDSLEAEINRLTKLMEAYQDQPKIQQEEDDRPDLFADTQ
jgi:hypothetical protein